MSWARARRIAAGAAGPRPAVEAALTAALGCRLAVPVQTPTPIPAYDVVAADGFAVSGPGPWLQVGRVAEVLDGRALPVVRGEPLPPGADAVLPYQAAVERAGADGSWLYVGDRRRDQPNAHPGHLDPGSYVVPRGQHAPAGTTLVQAGTLVTPTVVAAAAAAGADALAVVRPPDVAVVTIGDDRWDHGGPREGRDRDAATPLITTAAIRAGARCQPVREVPGRAGQLRTPVRAALDDCAADLTILTGPDGPAAHSDASSALKGLDATALVVGVAVVAGADALLAELPDGRLVAYVPGDLAGAVGALVTIVVPLLRVMGGHGVPLTSTALLTRSLPPTPEQTALVPGTRIPGELVDQVEPGTGTGVCAFTGTDVLIAVPPEGASSADLVDVLDLP
jgi:molybdopterin molybdotransferase